MSTVKKACIYISDGFEDVEAITPLDYLRRCGVDTVLAGVGSKQIRSAHGVLVTCDVLAEELYDSPADFSLVVLPGGLPNSRTLGMVSALRTFVETVYAQGGIIAALCAAPVFTFGAWGLLEGKAYTCYPGMGTDLSTPPLKGERVVKDGTVITACSAGAAEEFSFALIESFCGADQVKELQKALVAR